MFYGQGATVKRFVVLIRTLGTYNSILLVSWLPVLVRATHLSALGELCVCVCVCVCGEEKQQAVKKKKVSHFSTNM